MEKNLVLLIIVAIVAITALTTLVLPEQQVELPVYEKAGAVIKQAPYLGQTTFSYQELNSDVVFQLQFKWLNEKLYVGDEYVLGKGQRAAVIKFESFEEEVVCEWFGKKTCQLKNVATFKDFHGRPIKFYFANRMNLRILTVKN